MMMINYIMMLMMMIDTIPQWLLDDDDDDDDNCGGNGEGDGDGRQRAVLLRIDVSRWKDDLVTFEEMKPQFDFFDREPSRRQELSASRPSPPAPWSTICFDICFDIGFDICFYIWFDVCFDICFDIC